MSINDSYFTPLLVLFIGHLIEKTKKNIQNKNKFLTKFSSKIDSSIISIQDAGAV